MFLPLSALCLLRLLALQVSALSSPPTGAITVGPGGKYSTFSAALNDTSSPVSVWLTYRCLEVLILCPSLGVLCVCGDIP